jgi:hypothetical protein
MLSGVCLTEINRLNYVRREEDIEQPIQANTYLFV